MTDPTRRNSSNNNEDERRLLREVDADEDRSPDRILDSNPQRRAYENNPGCRPHTPRRKPLNG